MEWEMVCNYHQVGHGNDGTCTLVGMCTTCSLPFEHQMFGNGMISQRAWWISQKVNVLKRTPFMHAWRNSRCAPQTWAHTGQISSRTAMSCASFSFGESRISAEKSDWGNVSAHWNDRIQGFTCIVRWKLCEVEMKSFTFLFFFCAFLVVSRRHESGPFGCVRR